MTLNDTRQITGQLLAFDVHMNLVLSEAEEFRVPRKQQHAAASAAAATKGGANGVKAVVAEEKRTLGLIILRGEWIISISVEGPPPADPRDRLGKAAAGPGMGRSVGRGVAAGGPALGQVPGMSALGGLGGPISRNSPGSFAPAGVGRGFGGR